MMEDFIPDNLVECELSELERYAGNLDCEFSQDQAESRDGETLIVMEEYYMNNTRSTVLGLKRTIVDEEGNESVDAFIDPDYRNTCIDLEIAHPELFR
jgi:hypothetical protein